MKLEHGINIIWDMEINEYNDIYLSDMYEDSSIEFVKQYGDDELYPFASIRKTDDIWLGSTTIPLIDLPKEIVLKELEIIKQTFEQYYSFSIGSETYPEIYINVLIRKDRDIPQTLELINIYAEKLYEDLKCLKSNKVSSLAHSYIASMLPVYQRAMSKIQLELSNFITDDEANKKKVVDIGGRVKTLDSICEKIKRKSVSQFEVFNRFDDIAGVRCTCEYLDDVYEILEYIKNNPLLKVIEIDDKIDSPTKEGYRGIHVIVSCSVYYKNKLYKDIKVEVQLRTAFQNAWSMKTHDLTYKKDDIESEEIRKVLKELSDTLRMADETALKMKELSKAGHSGRNLK